MAVVACLDTRVYMVHFAEKPAWTGRIVDAARLPRSMVVSSTVTITELVYLMTPKLGLETLHLRIGSARQSRVRFLPVSEEIAERAGGIVLENRNVPLADSIIAATALVHTRGRVCTDDPHFASIPGIQPFWGRT